MLRWTSPSGQGGRTLEIRVQGGEVLYTLVDGIPEFVEPSHVAAVTTAITSAVPGATVTMPPAAQ